MVRKLVVGILIATCIGGAPLSLSSCKKKPMTRNSAVDKRKKQMSMRKQKQTELGCPLKDCK